MEVDKYQNVVAAQRSMFHMDELGVGHWKVRWLQHRAIYIYISYGAEKFP